MRRQADFDRSAAAWLEEGPDELADRVLETALAEVHVTRQRRALRVPWRFPCMPALKRSTSVTALIVVAAVGAVAIYLGPAGRGAGGPSSEPSSAAATASASPRRTPDAPVTRGTLASSAVSQVREGPLSPGRYEYLNVDQQFFNVQFTVPAGWTWSGRSLMKGALQGEGAISFYGGPLDVYADPCHWATGPSMLAEGYGQLAGTLAAQPGRAATGLATWSIGSRSGVALELTVPSDVDIASCDGGEFRSWGPEDRLRSHEAPGQRDLVLATGGAVGFEGEVSAERILAVDAATLPDTPADVVAEMRTILESMYIGLWG